jgi:hypothetical protein
LLNIGSCENFELANEQKSLIKCIRVPTSLGLKLTIEERREYKQKTKKIENNPNIKKETVG